MTKKANIEKQETNTEETTTVTLVVIGACRVRIGGENYHFEDEIEIEESALKEKGVQYLFANKLVEFLDDSRRTKEFIKEITANKKVEPELTLKERETGAEYK